LYGRPPVLPLMAALQVANSKTHTTETWVAYLNHYLPVLHDSIRSNIQKAQDRQKRYYD
ncbi:hypothetical protein BX666DRAFT_1813497, partial [Dichotomocladium elegans]